MPTPKSRERKRARTRALQRAAQRRAAEAGYLRVNLWVPKAVRDLAWDRTRPLDVHLHSVLSAALARGLRVVSTSEIIACSRQWHRVFALPACPTWKGRAFTRAPRLYTRDARGRIHSRDKGLTVCEESPAS